jgi:IclR family KDG regulon transcriptional repressor
MSQESHPSIQVVGRAFSLLELLATTSEPLATTDIAVHLGVSVQNANNLLRVLFHLGYVSQDQSRRYRLGVQCCFLGSAADRWRELRERCGPVLLELASLTGLGVFVGVIENDRLYACVNIRPGERQILPPKQKWGNELHSTACGRVLLAALTPSRRRKLFARTQRRKLTPATVTNTDALEVICRQVKREHYAEVRNESVDGVCSLAIPLHSPDGTVAAGLAFYGSSQSWDAIPLERKLTLLETARDQLERH